MSTGNEVVDLQGALDQQSGERGRDGWSGTFDTNRPSLEAALTGMGYEVVDLGIVSDELSINSPDSSLLFERVSFDSSNCEAWTHILQPCAKLSRAQTYW